MVKIQHVKDVRLKIGQKNNKMDNYHQLEPAFYDRARPELRYPRRAGKLYTVFCHTDCNADIRDLVGFVPIEKYGTAIKAISVGEFGACEEFRFINSAMFQPFLAAGAAVGSTGMASVGGANIDVYPLLIIGEDAWCHVSLKGKGYTCISPTYLPPTGKNHANPMGQVGYVGADFWYEAVRLNENFMTRVECAVSNL